MNKDIKGALRHKNRLYKKYISGGQKRVDEINLSETSIFDSNLIADAKSSYFSSLGIRLNDPSTGPKTYWSILKRLMNKVKIPSVPPLLVNNLFVTDFTEKAGIFNTFLPTNVTFSKIVVTFLKSIIRLTSALAMLVSRLQT